MESTISSLTAVLFVFCGVTPLRFIVFDGALFPSLEIGEGFCAIIKRVKRDYVTTSIIFMIIF